MTCLVEMTDDEFGSRRRLVKGQQLVESKSAAPEVLAERKTVSDFIVIVAVAVVIAVDRSELRCGGGTGGASAVQVCGDGAGSSGRRLGKASLSRAGR